MSAPGLRHLSDDQRGFTLIELLIVMLIIGVLAEIALPSFLDQSSKGHDATAKAAVHTAQTAIEAYRLDHGDYCGASATKLVAIEPALAQASGLSVSGCAGGDTSQYSISVPSSSSLGTTYTVNMAGGLASRTCSTPGQAACPSTGRW